MEEIKIKDYAVMVKAVRDKQNEYFAAVKSGLPSTSYKIKEEAMRLEKQLDLKTTEIITGNIQGQIF